VEDSRLMHILGLNLGHDGQFAVLQGNRLVGSYEQEKDSGKRYAHLSASTLIECLLMLDNPPDVVALSGWHDDYSLAVHRPSAAPYFGAQRSPGVAAKFVGDDISLLRVTHERSHLMCSLGLSAWAGGNEELTAIVYEGHLGHIYRISPAGEVLERREVLKEAGARYAGLMAIADPDYSDTLDGPKLEYAGKLMALEAFGSNQPSGDVEKLVLDLLNRSTVYPINKQRYSDSPVFNAGIDSNRLADAARMMSQLIWARFNSALIALRNSPGRLLIGGGSGLHCGWNTRFAESSLCSEVFVPPTTNDSGVALGGAIDAFYLYNGAQPIDWHPQAGRDFVLDIAVPAGWTCRKTSPDELARLLASDHLLAWVSGRCEIGPRALGGRSILGAPFDRRTRERLNEAKAREWFRPVAPVCRAQDASAYFDGCVDPFMLRFAAVREPDRLAAVAHHDRTARVQAIPTGSNAPLEALLDSFGAATGVPVLCNTSLNYRGRGFINRLSDLLDLCGRIGVAHAFVNGLLYEHEA
jgi:hydroxymethyl cephem carbamoyltransferase